jgi:hypothetical protein
VKLCYEWIHLSLQGIDYYNTYYKLPLLFCVTLVGLGWIGLLILETNSVKSRIKVNKYHKLLIHSIFLILAISSFLFINGKYFPDSFLLLLHLST